MTAPFDSPQLRGIDPDRSGTMSSIDRTSKNSSEGVVFTASPSPSYSMLTPSPSSSSPSPVPRNSLYQIGRKPSKASKLAQFLRRSVSEKNHPEKNGVPTTEGGAPPQRRHRAVSDVTSYLKHPEEVEEFNQIRQAYVQVLFFFFFFFLSFISFVNWRRPLSLNSECNQLTKVAEAKHHLQEWAKTMTGCSHPETGQASGLMTSGLL